MQDIQSLLGNYDELEKLVVSKFKELGLSFTMDCDHICYRVANLQRYQELKSAIQTQHRLLVESQVNGRPICIFSLAKPAQFGTWAVPCLELPAPKPGRNYLEGWEHAEFVTGMPLPQFQNQHKKLSFDTRAAHKQLNPEISLQISPHHQVKFHPSSIRAVIEQERKIS